jgi:phosphatidylserine/phosphatidylglycerophosphate/cardiolipin synthase-like enzyme
MGPGPTLKFLRVFLFLACAAFLPARAHALEGFCDPSVQDCRAPLLQLIANERVGIDMAFWFMEDPRYTAALIKQFNAGVRVRVIVDQRANAQYPLNATRLAELAAAGIPMRQKTTSGILHWKAVILDGQGTVQFGGANYSTYAWHPLVPYQNYTDEIIRFTEQPSIVGSFMTKFDDQWTSTNGYANYANIKTTPVRQYSAFPKDPSLNFPASEDYGARAVKRYNAETSKIDVLMYRITDRRHADAMIAAVGRGVQVRLITEQQEYRDPRYLWDAWNVDRMYMAGVKIKQRQHAGLNHGKLVLLQSQQLSIFGSSNWTSASSTSQAEHNQFLVDPTSFEILKQQFLRKWNNATGNIETVPFTPLPPQTPAYMGPAPASRQSTTVRLSWKPGYWAHQADIYFGTSPNPPLVARDVPVSPNTTATYTLPVLARGTTYYWRIVSKTMANKTKSGPVWTFGT